MLRDSLSVSIDITAPAPCPTPNIPPTENFDFAEALASICTILEKVFSYLNYQELQTVALVNKSWEIIAKRVQKNRDAVGWVTLHRKKRKSYLTKSSNYDFNSYSSAIILLNYWLSHCFYEGVICLEGSSLTSLQFLDFLQDKVMPKECEDCCVISCYKLLSIYPDPVKQPCTRTIFEGCVIPRIPNVQVCRIDPRNEDFVCSVSKLRCLLMFFDKSVPIQEQSMFLDKVLLQQEVDNIALGGAVVLVPTMKYIGLAFYEPPTSNSCFSAFSIVIEENADFAQQIQQFKNSIIARKRSLAFRICTRTKCEETIPQENEIFHRFFPNTSILGIEDLFLIGLNSFPNCSNANEDGSVGKSYVRNTGTVFVFLTWGVQISK